MLRIVTFCVISVIAKGISSQCIRGPFNAAIATPIVEPIAYGNIAYGAEAYANPWLEAGYGLNLATLAASNRCGFSVTSSSPISPNGVSILSENMVIEGPLAVNGQLPFLGTIGVEGNLPASGVGVVAYGCGNGNVGITNEAVPGAGYGLAGPYGMAPVASMAPVAGMPMNGLYGGCAGIY